MSLEQTLERIAVAIEKLVDLLPEEVAAETPQADAAEPKAAKPRTRSSKPKTSKSTAPTKHENQEPPVDDVAKQPAVTLEQVREGIRRYAKTFGKEAATQLAINYGAVQDKPRIADIAIDKFTEVLKFIDEQLNKKGEL